MKKDTIVRRVTGTNAVCDAMNSNHVFKEMLPTVHQLIRLYKTIPITSAKSERTFSALRRLFTYLRSSMSEHRLNNCLLLHVHKDVTDLISIASDFVCAHDERRKHFGHF